MRTAKLSGSTLRLLAVLALALPLGGCLQPVHAPGLVAGAPTALSSIAVAPMTGFLGHELKTQLDFALSGGVPAPQLYRLELAARETTTGAIVDVQTGRAQTATLLVDVDYVLIDIATSQPVTRGRVQGSASFDRTQQRFASLRANRDAQTRAARMVSELLRARLIAALATRPA